MTRKITALLGGLLLVCGIGVRPAHADAINILYSLQSCAVASAMSGDFSDSNNQCTTFPTGVGANAVTPSSAAGAAADVTTYNLGPSAFRALLSTSATALSDTSMPAESGSGIGSSFFDLSFDLLLPHVYEFIGDVTLLGSNTNGTPSGLVTFTGPGISFSTLSGPTTGIGILAPGSYVIHTEARSEATTGTGGSSASDALATASFDLHMGAIPTDVTAVPEPGSMILLGTGLMALARRRFRK